MRQLADPLVVILLAAAAISAFVGDTIDAVAVSVLMNAILGFVQEWRAERTLSTLAAMRASTARVAGQACDRGASGAALRV